MIFFHSLHDFILMHGFGKYVWASYILSILGGAIFLWYLFIKRNKCIQAIKKSQPFEEKNDDL